MDSNPDVVHGHMSNIKIIFMVVACYYLQTENVFLFFF